MLFTLANCTDFEQAVEIGKGRCDTIGYKLDNGEMERVAGLGCIERQADSVMVANARRVNLGVSVVTAGAIVGGM